MQRTDPTSLVQSFKFDKQAEGRRPRTIEWYSESLARLQRFLESNNLSTDVRDIGPHEIRRYIAHLQQQEAYQRHPFAKPQGRPLKPDSVNCWVRGVRASFSWLVGEGYVEASPFNRVKAPRVPSKVVKTFSADEMRRLLSRIDIRSLLVLSFQAARTYTDYAAQTCVPRHPPMVGRSQPA